MNILPMNLQLIVIIVLFQGFLVLLVIYLFIDKFFSSRKFRQEQAIINESAYKQSLDVLRDAKLKAQEILSTAEKQASATITSADIFGDELQKNYKESFQTALNKQEQVLLKTTEALVTDLKDNFGKEKITSLAGFNNLLGEFRSEVKQQVDTYSQMLTKNTLDTENELKEEIKGYADSMKKSISEFEQQQKEKLKELTFKSLVWVNKEFFSSAVSINDHEELIRKILSEASLREKLVQ